MASGASTFSAGRGLARRALRSIDQGRGPRSFERSKPKSTKFAFRNRDGTSKRLPLSDPISRVAVESGTCRGRGAFPACCGDSDTLDVWPEPPFRLSRFPTQFLCRWSPRDRREEAAVGLASPAARAFAIRWHLKAASPNGPTSRVAVESGTYRGEAPSRPASAHRAPWMFGPSPLFDLVVFRPNSSRVYTPRPGPRGEPSRYTPRRRGHGASNPPLVTREPDQGVRVRVRVRVRVGVRVGVPPTRQEACLWAWRCSKKPLELSCDRYRQPE
ncbi:hypothetical protein G5714_024659 [Onychostoma macrolepis]|uniref:Uncharacterized protein n=1 Tax=Onychostoma macrolepis TaxID=369639 RepID=A0A7J6BH97_9TELE|nr:hypothetical protein G5714_024659 [Onychostoma macrolepis]